MYISTNKKPSKEEMSRFNMKVIEEDATIDYRVDFNSLDQSVKKQFCEYYNLPQEKSDSFNNITLSYNNEV